MNNNTNLPVNADLSTSDLFISYAWTSDAHRAWVKLLASELHLLGFNVKIDAAVDYGSSLSGFMQEVSNSRHVLLVVDENYVDRADNHPDSGVATENAWIKASAGDKAPGWLSVLFVDNRTRDLPEWLRDKKPKGFDFNASAKPGVVQLNDLWRWLEGLPADASNSTPIAELRRRSARLERIDTLRDPGSYASPELEGLVTFRHQDNRYYQVGQGEYEFRVEFTELNAKGVYVYLDSGLKALGLITADSYDESNVEVFLGPGRSVEPIVGQSVVLLNESGALCVIKIEAVQQEVNTSHYVHPYVVFSYKVLR